MSSRDSLPQANVRPPGRLNGWKEISGYLGKSVRTVQRWEKDLALPIHRIHGTAGEIVFALTAEIDQWQALTPDVQKQDVLQNGQNEGAHEVPNGSGRADAGPAAVAKTAEAARPWRVAAVAMLLLTLVATAGWAWTLWVASSGGPQVALQGNGNPAHWQVEKNRLQVYDTNRQLLFEHPFEEDLHEQAYTREGARNLVALADLENDGRVEVVFAVFPKTSPEQWLIVFNADGGERFRRRIERGAHYGDGLHAPPYVGHAVFVTTDADGKKSIWLRAHHSQWFASVVQRIDPGGEILGSFWNDGHVLTLQDAVLGGRRVMLVGGMNNEFTMASLAVLDYEKPGGSAPALDPKYQCLDCPAGRPLEYFLFPRMEFSVALEVRPSVNQLRSLPDGTNYVNVEDATFIEPGGKEKVVGGVHYTLGPKFHEVRGETGDSYRLGHVRLEMSGRLHHRFSAACEKRIFPLLAWSGDRFVPLKGQLWSPPRKAVAQNTSNKSRLSAAALRR